MKSKLLALFSFLVVLPGEAEDLRAEPFALPSFTVAGGGIFATSAGGRFSLNATVGQPDAGEMSGGNLSLIGGFGKPGHRLRIAREGELVRVSWDSYLEGGVLEMAGALNGDLQAGMWMPVFLASDAQSALFPASTAPRFFHIRKN